MHSSVSMFAYSEGKTGLDKEGIRTRGKKIKRREKESRALVLV